MVKKILLMLSALFLLNVPVLCFSDDILNQLEYSKYGQAFIYDSLGDRLKRLETDYFGMAQSGNVEERINRLIRISDNSKQAVFSYPDYSQANKRNKLKKLLSSTAEFFGTGYMTGFTPSFTGGGYNYAENMFANEYNDFLHNHSNYCPYNNQNNGLNTFFQNNYNPYYSNKPDLRNSYRQTFYSPPEIYSSSGVHIIND